MFKGKKTHKGDKGDRRWGPAPLQSRKDAHTQLSDLPSLLPSCLFLKQWAPCPQTANPRVSVSICQVIKQLLYENYKLLWKKAQNFYQIYPLCYQFQGNQEKPTFVCSDMCFSYFSWFLKPRSQVSQKQWKTGSFLFCKQKQRH